MTSGSLYGPRSVLEGDPHSVFRAKWQLQVIPLALTKGCIFIRAKYPIAVERLQIAIQQARESRLSWKNIFDSGFDFDIELRPQAPVLLFAVRNIFAGIH